METVSQLPRANEFAQGSRLVCIVAEGQCRFASAAEIDGLSAEHSTRDAVP